MIYVTAIRFWREMQYGAEGADYEKPHAITGIQRHWAEARSELSQPQYSFRP